MADEALASLDSDDTSRCGNVVKKEDESPRWPFWLRPAQAFFGLVAFAVLDAMLQLVHRAMQLGVDALPRWAVIAFTILGVVTVMCWVTLVSAWVTGRLFVWVLNAWSDVRTTIRGMRSSDGPSSSSS
jgi:hypothetical protein